MSQLEQRKKIKIFIDAGITSAKEISAKTGIPLRTIFRIKSILREGKTSNFVLREGKTSNLLLILSPNCILIL